MRVTDNWDPISCRSSNIRNNLTITQPCSSNVPRNDGSGTVTKGIRRAQRRAHRDSCFCCACQGKRRSRRASAFQHTVDSFRASAFQRRRTPIACQGGHCHCGGGRSRSATAFQRRRCLRCRRSRCAGQGCRSRCFEVVRRIVEGGRMEEARANAGVRDPKLQPGAGNLSGRRLKH